LSSAFFSATQHGPFAPLFDWQKIGNFSLFGAAFIEHLLLGMERGDLYRREVKDPGKSAARFDVRRDRDRAHLAINAVYIAVPVTEMKGALARRMPPGAVRLQNLGLITGIITYRFSARSTS
jgi:hypothetical protein